MLLIALLLKSFVFIPIEAFLRILILLDYSQRLVHDYKLSLLNLFLSENTAAFVLGQLDRDTLRNEIEQAGTWHKFVCQVVLTKGLRLHQLDLTYVFLKITVWIFPKLPQNSQRFIEFPKLSEWFGFPKPWFGIALVQLDSQVWIL